MKKIFLVVVIIAIAQGGILSKVGRHYSNKVIRETFKQSNMTSSPYIKKVLKNIKLKKFKILTPKQQLAQISTGIAKTSPFAKKMITTTNKPLEVVRYYTKYGNDFINNTKLIKDKVLGMSKKSMDKLNKMGVKTKKFIDEKQVIDRTLDVLKIGGKKSWETLKGIGKIANDNKLSAAAGVMYAWYLSDPQGFEEKLNEFAGSLGDFAKMIAKITTKTAINAAGGIVDGAVEVFKQNPIPFYVLIVLLVLYFGWNFRALIPKPAQNTTQNDNSQHNKRKGRY